MVTIEVYAYPRMTSHVLNGTEALIKWLEKENLTLDKVEYNARFPSPLRFIDNMNLSLNQLIELESLLDTFDAYSLELILDKVGFKKSPSVITTEQFTKFIRRICSGKIVLNLTF